MTCFSDLKVWRVASWAMVLAASSFISPAHATVHKCTGSDGKMVFGD